MRKISLVMAIVLVATTVFAGCTKKTAGVDTNEKMQLNFMVDLATVKADAVLIKEIEEQFNVKVNLTAAPTGSADDKRKAYNLQIASGETPDVISDVKFADYATYVKQDIIAEIPTDMIKSEAPDVAKWLETNMGENIWDYYLVDGKNYVVPTIWTIGKNFVNMTIREDWLNEVGITKIPDTLDELETAMVKIKEAKNIYPLTGDVSFYDFIFGAYGLYPTLFTENNGKVVYGAIEPDGKKALEVAHKWYEKGLIDPEFVINKEDQRREKWISEKAAVIGTAWYHSIPEEAYFGGVYHDKLIEKNPKAKPTSMLPPAGPNGDRGIGQSSPIVNAGIVFGKHLEKEPEKLKKYLQICNYYIKDFKKNTVGKEGVTFNTTADGNIEFIPPYDEKDGKIAYGLGATLVSGFIDYDVEDTLKPAKYAEVRKQAKATCVGKYDILGPAQRPIYTEKKEVLDKMVTKNMISFIIGDRNLNEFDQFVSEWNNAGGTEVMAEAQEYYKKLGLKK